MNGTTFGIGVRKDSSDTIVNSGSFNGNLGASVTMDTSFKRLVIDFTELSIKFFVNDILLHTVTATNTSNTSKLEFPVKMENVNSNGNTTDNSFEVTFASIQRLGDLITNPISYYQSGTTAGVVLKYSAGILRGLVVGGVTNNSTIILYDNTAASGTVIWSSGVMGAQTQPYNIDFGALPFSNGLTLVISGAAANVLTIYE